MSRKVKKEGLVAKLVQQYGEDAVRVNSQYHVQVAAKEGGWHDIWFNQWNEKKIRLHGNRTIYPNSSNQNILNILSGHVASKTNLAAMHVAKDMGAKFRKVFRAAELDKLATAVYVDAGWKEGVARISAVFLADGGDTVEAKVITINTKDSNEAEARAVDLGSVLRPDPGVRIFTDCQSVADTTPVPNVKWIPREDNKMADNLSSTRNRRKTRRRRKKKRA